MKNPQLFSGNDWIDLDDLKAWLGQQEDLKNFLNEPTILDSWQLPNDPLGFVQSQSNYHDLFDNRSDIYGTAGPSQSGSATPFSDYIQNSIIAAAAPINSNLRTPQSHAAAFASAIDAGLDVDSFLGLWEKHMGGGYGDVSGPGLPPIRT
ncbi:hypothetical protein B0H10DRAFT_2218201 [Mycena sp. CBHHK59/15]|nr:hypothetical protein B0H10DRAFT_2218201 [Mycena sp. CBHHK59/15]